MNEKQQAQNKLLAHVNEIYEYINDNLDHLYDRKYIPSKFHKKLYKAFVILGDVKNYLDDKLGTGERRLDLDEEGSFVIKDWAGNLMFDGEEYGSFDDAEEALSEKLGDDYDTDREEYNITEVTSEKKNPSLSKSESLKLKNLNRVLALADKIEKSGVGWYDRNQNNMVIYIRDEEITGKDQWEIARALENEIGGAIDIQPDLQSRTLKVRVLNVYPAEKNQFELIEGGKSKKNTHKKKWGTQEILVSKELTNNKKNALKVAEKFAHAPIIKMTETKNSFRFRIQDPKDFGQFKTVKTPLEGVKLIYGEEL